MITNINGTGRTDNERADAAAELVVRRVQSVTRDLRAVRAAVAVARYAVRQGSSVWRAANAGQEYADYLLVNETRHRETTQASRVVKMPRRKRQYIGTVPDGAA